MVCLAALPITPSGLGVRENLFVLLLAIDFPGFGVKHAEALATSFKLAAALKPGGLFVLEKQASGTLDGSLFEVIKSKRYGGSEILYLARK